MTFRIMWIYKFCKFQHNKHNCVTGGEYDYIFFGRNKQTSQGT